MYIPKHFRNEDMNDVKDFIRDNGFGILVTQENKKITATHLPFIFSKNVAGEDVLSGHISGNNLQLKNIEEQNEVLVIFQGANSYISASWYDHENVPTWNYIAVHVYGILRIIKGDELLEALIQLVNRHEAYEEKPVSVSTMSKNYLEKQLNGITGFEIKINNIEAAKKLSQNRDSKNYDNIITELEKKGDVNSAMTAMEMKKLKKG
jgi:transcriptional regulator